SGCEGAVRPPPPPPGAGGGGVMSAAPPPAGMGGGIGGSSSSNSSGTRGAPLTGPGVGPGAGNTAGGAGAEPKPGERVAPRKRTEFIIVLYWVEPLLTEPPQYRGEAATTPAAQ